MIDLSRVRAVIAEVNEMIEVLDGVEFDDTDGIENQSKGQKRQERARKAQDLQFLSTRFELCASLVRIEYWYAKGESDPLSTDRDKP